MCLLAEITLGKFPTLLYLILFYIVNNITTIKWERLMGWRVKGNPILKSRASNKDVLNLGASALNLVS